MGGQSALHAPWIFHQGQDTIGSSDAFLAALLTAWQAKLASTECRRRACAAGALAATHQGATPTLTTADVVAMLV